MIRMRAPEGMAFFAHQGHSISIDGEGIAMIDERHAADLRSHGFADVAEIDALFREHYDPYKQPVALTDRLGQLGMSDPRRIAVSERLGLLPTETLEMLADVADGKLKVVTADMAPDATPVVSDAPVAVTEREVVAPPETEAPGAPVPVDGALTDAQIDSMSRAQLTTWLKRREIPIVPPIDIDMLRAKAKHANAAA